MKKTKLTLVLLLIFSISSVTGFVMATDGSWITRTPMREARSGLGVAVANGKIYAIGGSGTGGFCTFNEEYDPKTDTWTFKTPMPTPRSDFGIAVYQDRIYCIGGNTIESIAGAATDVNEVYDPTTDTWETKKSMPSARLGLQANIVEDKIYLIGGYEWSNGTSLGVSSHTEVYDPDTDTWTSKASIPTAVSYYASAVVDNKIYVMTSNLNQIYDTENNSWSAGAPVPMPLVLASAGATKGKIATNRIYAFGANAYMPFYQLTVQGITTQSYNPATNNWTVCPSMPTGRFSTGVAVLNDSLYAIGGFTLEKRGDSWPDNLFPSSVPSAVNEQYTPVDNIPEFPSWSLMLLLLIVVMVLSVIYRRNFKLKQEKMR